MAQAGYTPISLYYSTTAAAVPVNTNLASGELAINITDGKLYYKDNGGTVRLLASNATSAPVLTFSAGTTGFTPNTATSGAITLAGTLGTANGGTNLTSFTSGGVVYASSSSALATGSALNYASGTGVGNLLEIIGGSTNVNGQFNVQGTDGTNTSFVSLLSGLEPNNLPSLFFSNGLRFSVATNKAASGYSEVFRATSTSLYTASGINVGIGTSNPQVKLEIGGTNPTINIGPTNVTSGAALSYNTAGNYLSINAVTQGVGYRNIILANDGGNVGIGTSIPFASPKLTVYNGATITTGGDGGGNGVFIAALTGSASTGQLVVAGSDTAAIDKGGAIVFAGKWDTALNDIAQWAKIAGYKENATNNNYSGYLGFYTRANGSTATEKMRLDSAGNLGLGVTPSAAWASSAYLAAQFGFGGVIMSSQVSTNTSVFNIGANFKYDGSDYRRINGEEASQYQQASGAHNWRIAASSTANSVITWTQAMTLDASGNLGVGTTSIQTNARFDVRDVNRTGNSTNAVIFSTNTQAANIGGTLGLGGLYDGSNSTMFGVVRGAKENSTSGNYAGYLSFGTVQNGGAVEERARIDSAGVFTVNNPAGTQYVQLTPTGSISSVHSNGGGGDSVFGAISGISNGYQITVTTGNAQTYKWHNGGSQSMTLGSDGNLLLGSTSNAFSSRLCVQGTAGVNTPDVLIGIPINANSNTQLQIYRSAATGGYIGLESIIAGVSGTNLVINNNNKGKVLIGGTNETPYGDTTGSGSTAIWQNRLFVSSADDCGSFNRITSDGAVWYWVRGGTTVGNVSVTTTTTSYNTTSDYRLKNVTGSLRGYKERLMSLQPKQGIWVANGSEFKGFIAHEFANQYPKSVTGEKDAVDADGKPVMQSMQASSSEVMADLVALVQEQQAIIESLKARLDAANL